MLRTKNAIKMVIASTVSQVVIVLAGFILPPLLISHYGSEINGLVNSVKQILSYFSFVSVGLGAASQVALYKPLAEKDLSKINSIMAELSLCFKKIGLAYSLFIGMLAFLLPVVRKDNLSWSTIVSVVLICGIGSLIEFVFITKYKILLTADQKLFIVSNVYTQGTLINTILSIILIYFNSPIALVQAAATLAYLIRMLILIVNVKHIYPFLNFRTSSCRKKIVNQKDAFLYKLTDILINYVPMTLVMLICGFKNTSIYSVYNLVFSAIAMIVSVFCNGFSATFGNLVAENKFENLVQSFKGYKFAFRTISFFFFGCAAILIIPFISIYIRSSDGVNYIMPSIGIMFAVNGILRAIRTPYITLIDAFGNYAENVKLNYIEALLNISISLILTIKFGMIGVLIGGSISALLRSIFFLIDVSRKALHIGYIREIFYLLINISLCILMYIVFRNIRVHTYFEWSINAIGVALVLGLILLFVNITIDKDSFKELMKRIKIMLCRPVK